MNADKVYLMIPINKTAGIVTSQSGCSDIDDGAAPHELDEQRQNQAINRRAELAKILGFDTKAKKRNNMNRINWRKNYLTDHPQSELLKEWYELGQESARICTHLESIKPKFKMVPWHVAIEWESSERICVAPDCSTGVNAGEVYNVWYSKGRAMIWNNAGNWVNYPKSWFKKLDAIITTSV